MPYLDDTGERDSWRAPRGKPADPGRLWQSVKWDWRWIPLAGVIWGVLGAGVAFGLVENTYRSSTALVWEPKGELRPDEREMGAEVASIKAPSAISRTRELLGLPISLAALSKQVDYQFEPHSRFVVLISDGASPEDAVKLGQVLLRVFLEQQRGFAQQRALNATTAREQELMQAQDDLQEARKALEDFRTKNNLPADDGAANAGGTGTDGGVAEVVDNSPDGLKLRRLRADLARVRSASPYDSRIPVMAAQLAALEARAAPHAVVPGTAAPGGKTPDGKPGAASPNTAHSKLWRYLATQQTGDSTPSRDRKASELLAGDARRRATELAEATAELKKKVESAQQHVASIEQAVASARAEASSAHDDWRVLTTPSKPSRPERAMQGVIAVAMPLTGMLVALLALLLRPLVDGRVYTAREASYWGRLPVLASTAWPRTREMFFPLVDELGQQAIGAPGCTLVVGASVAETKLAEELASWLDEGLISTRRRPESGKPMDTPVSGSSKGPIKATENIVVVERKQQPASGGNYTSGVHAWLGEVEGPALRRASRLVDRVIVLVSSGSMTFSTVGEIRTRLGRSSGVALVVLGLNPMLLKLPDQSGEVGRFWRYVRRASARA